MYCVMLPQRNLITRLRRSSKHGVGGSYWETPAGIADGQRYWIRS